MAEHNLVGKNYTTPDLVAKVTGKAKYAEDFRAEGMIFAKLLLTGSRLEKRTLRRFLNNALHPVMKICRINLSPERPTPTVASCETCRK